MASATTYRSPMADVQPGFGATLASEWTKLRSVRATYIETALAILLSIGMSALICLAIGSSWEDLSAADQASFDPVFASFFGSVFGFIILVVMGVTFVSSEYTSGMIRLTLTTTPRRGRVIAAKALIIIAVTLVIGTIITFGSFFVGQAVLASQDVPTTTLSDGDSLRAVIAGSLSTPLFPLLGAAFAVVLRSTASSITAIMALIFAPSIFGSLLPRWWQENLLRYLPGFASDRLMMTNPDTSSATYLEPGLAVVVLLAWLVGAFALAYFVITRRDV